MIYTIVNHLLNKSGFVCRIKSVVIIFCIFILPILNACSATKTPIDPSDGHTVHVLALTFSPDGKYVVSGGGDNTVRVWNKETGKHLKLFKGGILGRTESVVVSPDGMFVATAGYFDKKLRLWNLETGSLIKTFSGHSFFGAWSVVFSPDGKKIVSGGADGTLRVWDIKSGEQLYVRKGHKPGSLSDILSVAYSPNGKYIASASFDQTICLWDGETGRKLRMLKGHTGEVCSVVFDPTGKNNIASGSADGTVRLWDIEKGVLIKTFNGHSDMVNSVAFSPDGRYLLSASNDKTIRLWNIYLNKEEKVFRGHGGIIYSVSFSPDGKHFISGGRDKKIILWDKNSGKALRVFEKRELKSNVFKHPFLWSGVFFIILVCIFFAAKFLKKDVRSTQLRAFSEDKKFINSFKQTLRIEGANPPEALSTYKKLANKNREWHWNIVLLATSMPVIAFFISNAFLKSFDIPTWMTTFCIWLPIGFEPYFTARRNLEYSLSGREDPLKKKPIQKHIIVPLLNFFWDGIQIFIVAITAFLLTILATNFFALVYLLSVGSVSYSKAMDISNNYLALPMLFVFLTIVTLVWCSTPTRILSLRRLFIAIRLSRKNIVKFIVKIIVAIVLMVSVTGFFHQNPLYGGVLSLFIGILFSFEDGKSERYFVLNYLLKLAEVRCLIRLGKKLEAEWYLHRLLSSSERFHSLSTVKDLSLSLAYLFDKKPELNLAKDCIDRVRMAAEDKYGEIGRATILNTESIIIPNQALHMDCQH